MTISPFLSNHINFILIAFYLVLELLITEKILFAFYFSHSQTIVFGHYDNLITKKLFFGGYLISKHTTVDLKQTV